MVDINTFMLEPSEMFKEELKKRIASIRESMTLDPSSQYGGYRFKDTPFIESIILDSVGALYESESQNSVLFHLNENDIPVDFNFNKVVDGQYDILIKYALGVAASADFLSERDLNKH